MINSIALSDMESSVYGYGFVMDAAGSAASPPVHTLFVPLGIYQTFIRNFCVRTVGAGKNEMSVETPVATNM
ncbi:MAG: hypothetical protein HY912_01545 [Desulfomonile tiedjei]|uniref:Uncharacterized protein n=1 Tax=Desulfomonile tiedjei TaxID=2358 RepID=A0A9D6V2U5_9BACT|nr:hypothetical protein [Desulfomonile tiedjei]